MPQKTYIAIDLKSFYASVECVERGLNPLTANLVVADPSRTEKTICLAVSPSLKAYGIPGRARLFEAIQAVMNINRERLKKAPGHTFSGKSYLDLELKADPSLELDFVVAPPQMAKYMAVSAKIYSIYLRYVSPEDIHVYSIDEVFIDATIYLSMRGISAHDFAMLIIQDILRTTGITATAGIGTNLFLSKVAMDIKAKHIPADKDGVRIAELDEMSFRRQLWEHRPLTDFWRIGRGYARRLEAAGLFTMGDIARQSIYYEKSLYDMFGINAELLIDHAWGIEPCTIKDIKGYRPESSSISSGQVLPCPYDFEKGRIIVREMTDLLVLDLVDKRLVADQIVLTVGYDIDNVKTGRARENALDTDYYGRTVPKQAHGSINLGSHTSSAKKITAAVLELYDRIVDEGLLVRRMYVVANHVLPESEKPASDAFEQLDLFTDYEQEQKKRELQEAEDKRERRRQEALIAIQKKYGKNSILRGTSYEEGATTRERNSQIGGHKA